MKHWWGVWPAFAVMAIGAAVAPNSRPAVPQAPIPAIQTGTAVPHSASADSFEHRRHESLTCVTCHLSVSKRAVLNFERPRGCDICHHQAPAENDCARCHTANELANPRWVMVRVEVERTAPREGPAAFNHTVHHDRPCLECHTTPVTMAPASKAVTCVSCHEDHHDVDRRCAVCHTGPALQTAHAPPADPHIGCDACHDQGTVARLSPTRSLCQVCHLPQQDHYPNRQCTVCHFQASPEIYRAHLQQHAAG